MFIRLTYTGAARSGSVGIDSTTGVHILSAHVSGQNWKINGKIYILLK